MSEKRLPGIHEAIEKAVQSRCDDVLRGELSSWKIRCFL